MYLKQCGALAVHDFDGILLTRKKTRLAESSGRTTPKRSFDSTTQRSQDATKFDSAVLMFYFGISALIVVAARGRRASPPWPSFVACADPLLVAVGDRKIEALGRVQAEDLGAGFFLQVVAEGAI